MDASQISENAQGQPYCTQNWCGNRNLAIAWLLSTVSQDWYPACTSCLDRWAAMGASAADGTLITQPMYGTVDAPSPVAVAPARHVAADLIQTAVLSAAAIAWHEHNKRVSARLASSVMGRTQPDGVTPRWTDYVNGLHQKTEDFARAQRERTQETMETLGL